MLNQHSLEEIADIHNLLENIKHEYEKGIKPTLFFTKPFEAAFKNLPEDLVEVFGLEAVEMFDDIMRQNFKR